MEDNEQQTAVKQPANEEVVPLPSSSGGNGSGDPIGIDCPSVMNGNSSVLAMLIVTEDVTFTSFHAFVFPSDSSDFDKANFSSYTSASRQDISADEQSIQITTPFVTETTYHHIIVAGFVSDGSTRWGQKYVKIRPSSPAADVLEPSASVYSDPLIMTDDEKHNN